MVHFFSRFLTTVLINRNNLLSCITHILGNHSFKPLNSKTNTRNMNILLADMSLENWPVDGALNRLTYKNVYCAMCNGVDVTNNLDAVGYKMLATYDNEIWRVVSVEWWPAKVFCPPLEIERYLNNTPKHDHLITLINQ